MPGVVSFSLLKYLLVEMPVSSHENFHREIAMIVCIKFYDLGISLTKEVQDLFGRKNAKCY